MLDALLVTLSAVAALGVAATEFNTPVATPGARPAAADYALGRTALVRTALGRTALGRTALGRTALAAIAAVLLALLAWGITSLILGAETPAAAGAVLLVFGLWRLTGAIVRVSTAPGGAPDARSPDGRAGTATTPRPGAPAEGRGAAVAAAPADLVARWCSVALVVLTAALATGLAAAAIAGCLAAGLGYAALAAGPLRSFLDRGHEGVPALLVGVLLATLGTLWAGAGVGITWPGGGASILALFLGYLTVSVGAVEVARQWTRATRPLSGQPLPGETTEGG